jgi:hypothetical protein
LKEPPTSSAVKLSDLKSEGKRFRRSKHAAKIMKQPEAVETIAAKALRLLLRPSLDWRCASLFSFVLSAAEITELSSKAQTLFEREGSCLKLQAPIKVFGDIHGQYDDLMRLFVTYGSPSKLRADGDIQAYDYLFLGEQYLMKGLRSTRM